MYMDYPLVDRQGRRSWVKVTKVKYVKNYTIFNMPYIEMCANFLVDLEGQGQRSRSPGSFF